MAERLAAAGPTGAPAPESDQGQAARAQAPERLVRGWLWSVRPLTTSAHRTCAANAAHPLDIRVRPRSGRRWRSSRLPLPSTRAPRGRAIRARIAAPGEALRGRPCGHRRAPARCATVIDGECDDSTLKCERLLRNERVGSSTSVMSSRTSSSGTCKPARYTEAKVSPKRASPNRRQRFERRALAGGRPPTRRSDRGISRCTLEPTIHRSARVTL